MNNIFENAYFGKAYKTRDGRKKMYAELYPLPCDVVSEWQEEINEQQLKN